MIDIFDDPRLDIYAPRVTRYCRTCNGLTFVEEDGFLIDCPGPCKGTGLTDLPDPEMTVRYSMVICAAGHHLTGEGDPPIECPICAKEMTQ